METLQKGLPEIISWWKYTNTLHMLCRKVEAEAKPPEKADAVRKSETAEYGAWKDQWQRSKDDWQCSWQSSEDNWWNSKLLSCTWLPAFARAHVIVRNLTRSEIRDGSCQTVRCQWHRGWKRKEPCLPRCRRWYQALYMYGMGLEPPKCYYSTIVVSLTGLCPLMVNKVLS